MSTTATAPVGTPVCPAWCAELGGAAHENDQSGRGYYYHHADVLTGGRVVVTVADIQSPEWDSPQEDDRGVFIEVSCDDCLTPAEARAAGEALIKVASMLEEGAR